MGNASWNAADWGQHKKRTAHQTRAQIFTQSTIAEELDPSKIKFRESVDSDKNPQSTPIILAADETGSMGLLAEEIIRNSLGVIMEAIYTHKPVTDPHICCMGIGDGYTDQAPLQVTQFEADTTALIEQTKKIWLESNGGGNGGESYALVWWFATYKMKTDCWQKRGKKGYIFTIGDECCHNDISIDQIRNVLGVPCESKIPSSELLKIAQEHWHIYHLIVQPHRQQPVLQQWRELLGERAIVVGDGRHDKMAEIIVNLIAINEGRDTGAINAGYDDSTKDVIQKSVAHLLPAGG